MQKGVTVVHYSKSNPKVQPFLAHYQASTTSTTRSIFFLADTLQNNCDQRQRKLRQPGSHLRREEEDDTRDGKGGEPEGNRVLIKKKYFSSRQVHFVLGSYFITLLSIWVMVTMNVALIDFS